MYRVILGIDAKPEWYKSEQIEAAFRKKNIARDHAFIMDTASYYNEIKYRFWDEVALLRADSLNNPVDSSYLDERMHMVGTDLQPVQVRYFTKTGVPIFKMINCDIDPPLPMTWNKKHSFDDFPPKPIEYRGNNFGDSLQFFLKHLKTLDGKSVNFIDLPDADYYAIIIWNSFWIKPSNKLIKLIKKYNKEFEEKNTFILYVINHNAEIWFNLPEKLRQEVKEHQSFSLK